MRAAGRRPTAKGEGVRLLKCQVTAYLVRLSNQSVRRKFPHMSTVWKQLLPKELYL